MNEQQAKAELKKYGRVEYRGIVFAETLETRDGWQEYTGRYRIWVVGEASPITMDTFNADEAFQFAASLFV